jgi:RNA 2',3'-cyclic 3'-phosphodiesterase
MARKQAMPMPSIRVLVLSCFAKPAPRPQNQAVLLFLSQAQHSAEAMRRLFIGIDLPQAIKQHIQLACGGLAGARWQSLAQLHLTLRFIGEVDRHQANDIDAVLLGLVHPCLHIAVQGVGFFERKDKITTVWAGLSPTQSLHSLHAKICTALTRIGMVMPSQRYTPHITLARISAPMRTAHIQTWLAHHGSLQTAPFLVDAVILFESILTREGAQYTKLARYQLTL